MISNIIFLADTNISVKKTQILTSKVSILYVLTGLSTKYIV